MPDDGMSAFARWAMRRFGQPVRRQNRTGTFDVGQELRPGHPHSGPQQAELKADDRQGVGGNLSF